MKYVYVVTRTTYDYEYDSLSTTVEGVFETLDSAQKIMKNVATTIFNARNDTTCIKTESGCIWIEDEERMFVIEIHASLLRNENK